MTGQASIGEEPLGGSTIKQRSRERRRPAEERIAVSLPTRAVEEMERIITEGSAIASTKSGFVRYAVQRLLEQDVVPAAHPLKRTGLELDTLICLIEEALSYDPLKSNRPPPEILMDGANTELLNKLLGELKKIRKALDKIAARGLSGADEASVSAAQKFGQAFAEELGRYGARGVALVFTLTLDSVVSSLTGHDSLSDKIVGLLE